MTNHHPRTITFEGYECKLLERPLPCRRSRCKHGGFCRSCDACGVTVKGLVYHCATEDSEWDFHTRCVKLESEICIGDVIFRLKKQGPSKCLWCKKRLLSGASKNIPGWSYVSNYMDYSFHVNCVMDMADQHNNTSTSSGSDMSLALQGKELPLQTKSKGSIEKNKWLKIFQIFLKTILAILIGDPTTILASTLAHVVTQGLFHAG
ncbi:uncharacterized protein LOC141649890 [Silene latifolia]|uniref:uncharacterized protein LOC141649890 n=1 Tax=Silene latifolia TaxID=37657 RepID=UPI003D77D5AB